MTTDLVSPVLQLLSVAVNPEDSLFQLAAYVQDLASSLRPVADVIRSRMRMTDVIWVVGGDGRTRHVLLTSSSGRPVADTQFGMLLGRTVYLCRGEALDVLHSITVFEFFETYFAHHGSRIPCEFAA